MESYSDLIVGNPDIKLTLGLVASKVRDEQAQEQLSRRI